LIKIKKILIIIQRSNGDVLLSLKLINALYENYKSPKIDLLINDDTVSVAKLFPRINKILTFSYQKKENQRWVQEKDILKLILRKYDLSINLTASDRSVVYALLASKFSISAIDISNKKSWWKKILLTNYYFFDTNKHILENNLTPLNLLNIEHDLVQDTPKISSEVYSNVKKRLEEIKVANFLIFHPSAQYKYKVYPKSDRDNLIFLLNTLELPIIITGGNSKIDLDIKNEIPSLKNIYNFIGETSLEEYFVLSEFSLAYIGMDTLNMHIAAAQSNRIFAIFGPTKISMWSPWSNQLKASTEVNKPIQTYGENTIFQSSLPCKVCGVVGCGSIHGKDRFSFRIKPEDIFNEINKWYIKSKERTSNKVSNSIIYKPKKILLYIVYGDDQTYYDGAKFSFMTFMHWVNDISNISPVVLTEKPEKFKGLPIKILKMSRKQKNEWSLNGSYHFRIKNRGLAFVMDELNLEGFDKVLFFDTDTYFNKSPLPLFDLIKSNQALFYLNEGLIYDRKRFAIYVESLEGKKISVGDEVYQLSKKSALWGSLMVGITAEMRPSLEWADKLMIKFYNLVPSHTIEPFSLSESLLRKYRIVEGKFYVSLYSTSRKKDYAKDILSNFFNNNKLLTFDEQVRLAQNVKIKRPIFVILKQRLIRLIKK
jgi:heptosyltransferase III